MSDSLRARLLTYAPLAVCAVALLWHSLQYNFVTDDAFISFVYSRNLAEHFELVFNAGMDPVEGFTNFLWVVVLGLFMVVGAPPEIMALVLAYVAAVGTLVVTYQLMAYLRAPEEGDDDRAWDYVPAALLALCAGFACWTSGGLETQLFTFLVTMGIYAYVRGDEDGRWLRRAGWLLALSAMTRPEGLLVTAVVGLHRLGVNLARDRRLMPSRDELWCGGWFLGVWAPYFLWRWWYFGYPFPNTAYVKAGDAPAAYTAKLHAAGWFYLRRWVEQNFVWLAAPFGLLGALVAPPRGRRFFFGSFAVIAIGVYVLYVARVGGDFMGLHRFIMPLFVLAAVCFALGMRWLCRWIPARRMAICTALAVVVVAAFAVPQNRLTRWSMSWGNWAHDCGDDPKHRGCGIDTPAYLYVYTHDRGVIGKAMADCFEDGDFSILGGAGAKPYYARMKGIDVFGLVSEEIAHQIPPTRARAGHNKWAPDPFLFETYDPTFVFSCYAIHSRPDNAQLNCGTGSYWKSNGYELATIEVKGLRQILGGDPAKARAVIERGEDVGYYTFFKKKGRELKCPGVVE